MNFSFPNSRWNGRITDPKTRKGRAPVPVIRQLAERLEMHRLHSGNPETGPAKTGPIFANTAGKPLALARVVNRLLLPSLNRCDAAQAKRITNRRTARHTNGMRESLNGMAGISPAVAGEAICTA